MYCFTVSRKFTCNTVHYNPASWERDSGGCGHRHCQNGLPRLPASNEISQYLQDEHIGKREVGEGTVNGAEQCSIVDLGPDACQAEDRETSVVALVLEVIGVPPYERHSQVGQ